jgi:thiol-disulfide isomerase/thioredoxin
MGPPASTSTSDTSRRARCPPPPLLLAAAATALLLLLLPPLAAAVRETRLYDVLGCPPDADDRTIKRAYKKAALRWHPDRAEGDKAKAEEKFRDVAAAYEALSDPDKRKVYDRYGEAGLKRSMGEGGGPGGPGGGHGGHQFHMQGDPFEMFNMFFGGGGGGGMGGMGGGMGGGPRIRFGGGGGGGPHMGGGGMGGGGMGGRGGGGGGGSLYASDPHVQEVASEDAMPDRASGGAPRVGEAAVVLAEFYVSRPRSVLMCLGSFLLRSGSGYAHNKTQSPPTNQPAKCAAPPQNATTKNSSPPQKNKNTKTQKQAPWCGHCQQLAGKYSKAAAALAGVVRVVAVNCDAAGAVCSSRGVRGYPTIKAWVPSSSGSSSSSSGAGQGRWHDYSGERSAAALSKWAGGLIPGGRSEALRERGDLDALLARCGGPKSKGGKGGGKGGGAAASSGLCLVLATSKSETPSLWKALSLAYDGAVAFGTARRAAGGGGTAADALLAAARANNATAADAADAAAPAGSDARVVAVCNGDLSGAEIYTGRLKSDALRRFLRGYADGKKCRAALRLDASTDLAAMGVAQLKAVAEARGVTCDGGCLEKGDYIRALKASLVAGSGGGAAKEEL